MWLFFALLNPLAEAIRSMYVKKVSANSINDPLLIAWVNHAVPFVLSIPLVFFIEININTQVLIGLTGSGITNIIASILFMKALKEGELSTVMPMLSFTPLFLLVTSPIMVGEFPSAIGLMGIILIVTGSYLLNLKLSANGIFAPLRALTSEKGTRYMLIVSFIFSFSANFDKIAISASTILQHAVFINAFIFIGITIIRFIRGDSFNITNIPEKRNLVVVGVFFGITMAAHMIALSLTLVAYVVALKRLVGVISVIFGTLFLKEGNFRDRIAGSLTMFVGVLLILLS